MNNDIRIYPDKILRAETARVVEVDKNLVKAIGKLEEMLEKGDNAAGLAAPQIGISQKFFGIKNEKKEAVVYINPVIKKTFEEKVFPKIIDNNNKEEDFLEGCLSFPNYFGTVKRYLKIEVEWEELNDNQLQKKQNTLVGFGAIVFQHELDHLNGVLLIDRVKESKGKFFKVVKEKMVPTDVDEVK